MVGCVVRQRVPRGTGGGDRGRHSRGARRENMPKGEGVAWGEGVAR